MMRDGEIINHVNTLNKKVAMLYKQNVFTECRMRAFESVLGVTSLWSRILYVFFPGNFFKLVDKVQFKLMADHDEQLRQASAEAAKPKIIAPSAAQAQAVVNGR